MVQTKKKPAGKQPAGEIRGVQSLTKAVYHSKQPDDLVPNMPSAHLLPIPDGTVKSLFYWAMDLDITQGARIVLLTVIRHVTWADGTGCTASILTLAHEAHMTRKTTIGHIKTLIDAGLISRKRRFSKATETLLATSTVGVETTPTVSVVSTPASGRSGNASNQSSSSNLSNQSNKPKMSKKKQPETEKKKPQEEEKTTKTTEDRPPPGGTAPMAHAEDVDAWLETNMPASPMSSFAEAMLRHYKKHWWQPFVSYGWHTRMTVAKAAKVYTVDLNTWQQLRVDLRDKILRGGLPPDVEYHDSKPKLKVPLRCDTCQTVSITYQEDQKLQSLEETFVDRCDACLSKQPVGV